MPFSLARRTREFEQGYRPRVRSWPKWRAGSRVLSGGNWAGRALAAGPRSRSELAVELGRGIAQDGQGRPPRRPGSRSDGRCRGIAACRCTRRRSGSRRRACCDNRRPRRHRRGKRTLRARFLYALRRTSTLVRTGKDRRDVSIASARLRSAANGRGDPALAGRRVIAEPAAQGRALALVDAERGRALGAQCAAGGRRKLPRSRWPARRWPCAGGPAKAWTGKAAPAAKAATASRRESRIGTTNISVTREEERALVRPSGNCRQRR